MEKWTLLSVSWSAFFLAALSPGPNMLAVMQRALGSGRRAAVGVAIGIALGSFGWAVSTSFGVAFLLNRIPSLIPVIAILGGSYLISLGVGRLRAWRRASGTPGEKPTLETRFAGDIAHGFVVIASNPKVVLFWLSLSAIITKSELRSIEILLFSISCSFTALVIYSTEAFIFSRTGFRSAYFRRQVIIDVFFSFLFIAIGLHLVWNAIET